MQAILPLDRERPGLKCDGRYGMIYGTGLSRLIDINPTMLCGGGPLFHATAWHTLDRKHRSFAFATW